MHALVLDEGGAVSQRSEIILSGAPVSPMPTIMVVPGAEASAHWLHLPTRNDQQARAAARLQLQDQLAVGDEDVHIALGPLEADGYRLAVVVAVGRMRAWLQAATVHGVRLDAMAPDYAMLPPPLTGEPLSAAHLGDALAVRGPRTALSVEPDLAEVLLKGLDVRTIDDPLQLEQTLWRSAGALPVNLLQGEFDPSKADRLGWRDFRRAAILASLLLISPLVLAGVETLRYVSGAQAAEQRISDRVAAAVPGAEGDPITALQAEAAQLRIVTGGGPAQTAAQLFAAIESVDRAQLEILLLMPNGDVRATVSHQDSSDIELLRSQLKRSGLALREDAVRQEGDRMVSDLVTGVQP